MKLKLLSISALIGIASIGSTMAVTVATGTWLQYNFTDGWNPAGKDNFNYYITSNGGTNSTYAAGAIDSLGNTIDGISLTSSGWDGHNFLAGINASIDGDATGAPGTSTWSGDELVNFWWNGTANDATITISGLDPTKTYNIYYYSKINQPASTNTHTLDINGTAQLTAMRGARYGSDQADLVFNDISLNGSNELAMSWSGGNPFVNSILIETVPEPSSTALLGLGGLALLLRRRK
ncbi:MAG: PEP-CTERM sorting domain-containing protein [Akkermansiaceae bacterium]